MWGGQYFLAYRTNKNKQEQTSQYKRRTSRELQYFGHLKRSEGLGKILFHVEGRINGKRERGRPRMEWERYIRDGFNKQIIEARRLALDRERFRSMVKDAASNRILAIRER